MKTKIQLCLVALLLVASASAAARERIKIRLAPMPGIGHLVPELARGLGYFEQEGIEVETINVMDYLEEDFYSADLLNNGTIDAEICWYQRVTFGIGNGQPLRAVMLLEHSPHMMISVANRMKDQIKTAADFKGRNIADSAGFSTKRYLTDYVLKRAGLTPNDYTALPLELSQKLPLLTTALKAGQVDIVSSMEPLTAGVMATNLVTPLFDLTTKDGTVKALGHIWPARCLYLAPKYIEAHPDRVQKLVNAFVRTMRFINTHSAEEIMARMPAAYYAPDMNNDLYRAYKKTKIDEIAKAKATFTDGDYSFPPEAIAKACDVIEHTNFDETEEGQYRRKAAQSGKIHPEETYDNRFVVAAMKQIK